MWASGRSSSPSAGNSCSGRSNRRRTPLMVRLNISTIEELPGGWKTELNESFAHRSPNQWAPAGGGAAVVTDLLDEGVNSISAPGEDHESRNTLARRRRIEGDDVRELGVGLVSGIIVADGSLRLWPRIATDIVPELAVFILRGIGWKRERES
jgi:hypothetical protein